MTNTATMKRIWLLAVLLLALALSAIQMSVAYAATPGFSKVFAPDIIGPGSVSTLTFTIDNSAGGVPLDSLAFTDTLPGVVAIADPANASTTCVGGIVTAPDSGGTITFSDGDVGAGE